MFLDWIQVWGLCVSGGCIYVNFYSFQKFWGYVEIVLQIIANLKLLRRIESFTLKIFWGHLYFTKLNNFQAQM